MSILIEYPPRRSVRPFTAPAHAEDAPASPGASPSRPAARGSLVALDAADAFAAFLNRRILAESVRIERVECAAVAL